MARGVSAESSARDPGGEILPLTSLRFGAALYVLLFHFGASFLTSAGLPGPLATFLGHGYLGVGLFFVLSGFILQTVYGANAASAAGLRRFALARFARIYPVYLLALLLAAPFAAQGLWSEIPQFLLIQAWMPVGSYGDWNFTGWTLSVEAFFYLCFPLLGLGIARARTGAVQAVLAGAAALMFALSVVTDGWTRDMFGGTAWIYLPVTRLPEFVMGVCLGELARRGVLSPRLAAPLQWIAAVAAVAVLGCAGAWVAGAATLLFALLILALARGSAGLVHRWGSHPLLVLLGGASYALYLLQYPVRRIVAVAVPGDSRLLEGVIYLPAVILASILTFRFFEEPCRRLIRAAGRRGQAVGRRQPPMPPSP